MTSTLVAEAGGESEVGELKGFAGVEFAGGLERGEAGSGDGEGERAGREIGEGEAAVGRGGGEDGRPAGRVRVMSAEAMEAPSVSVMKLEMVPGVVRAGTCGVGTLGSSAAGLRWALATKSTAKMSERAGKVTGVDCIDGCGWGSVAARCGEMRATKRSRRIARS